MILRCKLKNIVYYYILCIYVVMPLYPAFTENENTEFLKNKFIEYYKMIYPPNNTFSLPIPNKDCLFVREEPLDDIDGYGEQYSIEMATNDHNIWYHMSIHNNGRLNYIQYNSNKFDDVVNLRKYSKGSSELTKMSTDTIRLKTDKMVEQFCDPDFSFKLATIKKARLGDHPFYIFRYDKFKDDILCELPVYIWISALDGTVITFGNSAGKYTPPAKHAPIISISDALDVGNNYIKSISFFGKLLKDNGFFSGILDEMNLRGIECSPLWSELKISYPPKRGMVYQDYNLFKPTLSYTIYYSVKLKWFLIIGDYRDDTFKIYITIDAENKTVMGFMPIELYSFDNLKSPEIQLHYDYKYRWKF